MTTRSPTSTGEAPTPQDEYVTLSKKKDSPQQLPESSHTSEGVKSPLDSDKGGEGVAEGGDDSGEITLEILDAEQLEERLGETRKAVIVGKYEEAIFLLPSCLATISAEYGELSARLVEPHFLYGKSLFECARSGTGVFGEGLLKEDSKEDSKEGSKEGEDELCPEADSTEEVKETEPTNFELAWENLEVSRVICSRHLEKEGKDVSMAKILFDATTCLGELQVETGCYEKAASDYADCLKLLEKFPDISSKQLLSATYYSMGISCSLSGKHEQAVRALESAMETLKELLSEEEENSAEWDSLKELIKEIALRLLEAQEQVKEGLEAAKTSADSPPDPDQPTSSSNGDKQPPASDRARSKELGAVQVNDISHLVRKKRPAEESAAEPDDGKRSKRAPSEEDASPGES